MTTNYVSSGKTVEQALEDQLRVIKAAKDKTKAMAKIAKSYPDATMILLENNNMHYASALVTKDTKGVKAEIMRSPQGRFVLRWRAKFGDMPMYSLEARNLDTASILEYVNEFINTPSGKSALQEDLGTKLI